MYFSFASDQQMRHLEGLHDTVEKLCPISISRGDKRGICIIVSYLRADFMLFAVGR